ncbi:MAG: hypothetical protein BWY76_02838 [bacterium ADurb.Bin429]|nr:MAG: hypothetical protein BWY76_02838 [bacterium ADurb.Bin429]
MTNDSAPYHETERDAGDIGNRLTADARQVIELLADLVEGELRRRALYQPRRPLPAAVRRAVEDQIRRSLEAQLAREAIRALLGTQHYRVIR